MRKRLRVWQFSLRSLLIALTVASIPCGAYAWQQARQRAREERLALRVEEFNQALDEMRLFDAQVIAHQALAESPQNDVAILMVQKSRLALIITHGAYSDYFCGHGGCLGP